MSRRRRARPATASGGYDDQGRQIVSVEVLGAADADGNIPVRAAAVNPGEATVVYTIRKSGYGPATVEQKVRSLTGCALPARISRKRTS